MTEVAYRFYDMQSLARCISDDDIENALNELGISQDMIIRTQYLHDFMGTTYQLSMGEDTEDFTPDQEYKLAKLQLIAINES